MPTLSAVAGLTAAAGLAFKVGGGMIAFEPWSDKRFGLGTGVAPPMDDAWDEAMLSIESVFWSFHFVFSGGLQMFSIGATPMS